MIFYKDTHVTFQFLTISNCVDQSYIILYLIFSSKVIMRITLVCDCKRNIRITPKHQAILAVNTAYISKGRFYLYAVLTS
jgi:hypothetical protein